MPRRKRVNLGVGAGNAGLYGTVRSKSSGKFTKVGTGGFDPDKHEALIPEAYKWQSVGRAHATGKASLSVLAKQLNDLLKPFVAHMGKETGKIAYMALIPVYKKSQLYVPVDTGDLRRSGKIELKKRGDGTEVASVSYGLAGKPYYAVFVHEKTEVGHLAPTRAKFLEDAFNEELPKVKKEIARLTKIVVGV